MTLGFIGLGKMGQNIVFHLLEQAIDVVVYNRTQKVSDIFKTEILEVQKEQELDLGTLTVANSLTELVKAIPSPRVIFMMVKAGEAVDEVLEGLQNAGLTKGDIVIDGGNSYYEDSVRRYTRLQQEEISYIDCGTSGGLEGARFGACLMLGGDQQTVESMAWLWDAMAGITESEPESVEDQHTEGEGCCVNGGCGAGGCGGCDGCGEEITSAAMWTYFGPSGAGHFVKMVHNGVEYGIDQAIGEGFHLLAEGPYKQLDLSAVASTWSQGSVVRGWLVELLQRSLSNDPRLEKYHGVVGGGQTGQWTIDTAKKHNIPQPILETALQARRASNKKPTFATKVVSALRFEYGGHTEDKDTSS